jgi:hypothetical protein
MIVTNCNLPTTKKGIVTVSEKMREILPDFVRHLIPLPKLNGTEDCKTEIQSALKQLLQTNHGLRASHLVKLVTIDGESLEVHHDEVSNMKAQNPGLNLIQQTLEVFSPDCWIVHDRDNHQEESAMQIYLAEKKSDRSYKFKVFQWTGGPSIFDSSKEMADTFVKKVGSHANIIEIYNISPNVTVEESGESWADLIQKQSAFIDEDAEVLLQNLRCAIKHLHGIGVVHGEVTPGSVLVRLNDNGSIKCTKLKRFQNAIWIANNGEFMNVNGRLILNLSYLSFPCVFLKAAWCMCRTCA